MCEAIKILIVITQIHGVTLSVYFKSHLNQYSSKLTIHICENIFYYVWWAD